MDGGLNKGLDDEVQQTKKEFSSEDRGYISFRNYSFRYINSEKPNLKNIDIKIEPGEMVIIVGPSGCGKTTLLRSIIGLIPHMYPGATKGTVHVDNLDVSETQITQLARSVGFVFQNPENQIFMFSVERDVAFGLENLGIPQAELREKVAKAMNLLGISHLSSRAPHELSDGQKQRVALAGILAMEPDILILDEPTSLLDPSSALELIEIVQMLNRKLGLTVLIVEHRLDLLVKAATRIICLNKGEIIADGSPRKVLKEKQLAIIGIGIPVASRLHQMLGEERIDLGDLALSMTELTAKYNGIIK
jgi:energy-coupling factor transporter ATP-binding protein EcfA2